MNNDERYMEKLAQAKAKYGRPFKTEELSPRTAKKSDYLRKLERLTQAKQAQVAVPATEIAVLQDYRKSANRQS